MAILCYDKRTYLCRNKITGFWTFDFCVFRKREKQRLEAAQMKFLRHLLGITKLEKEKNHCIREKTRVENIVKEIKQYHEKWLQHI